MGFWFYRTPRLNANEWQNNLGGVGGPIIHNKTFFFAEVQGLRTERFKLELRADGTNITNSVSFNAPTVDITHSTVGRIRKSVASGSRKIQIGAKIHF